MFPSHQIRIDTQNPHFFFLPGYFNSFTLDFSFLAHKADLNSENDFYKDFKFTKWMTKNVKLQGIPYSAFYCPQNKPLGEDYVRYCFFKVMIFHYFMSIFGLEFLTINNVQL